MQRVKGLMTGSLPTFIDAGSNFASSAVNEDHLLRQMRTRYKDFYFMGDDTWVNLYPEIFESNKTFESDSFKMFDLDTVDNRILEHLWPILDQSQWQVAIAHFLGVDHCGHTFGPSHPNMATKLNQMNNVIEQLVDRVDDKTLLVVMGDHGMSVEGDHGGESVEELISTLFLYSARPLTDTRMKHLYQKIHQSRAHQLGYNMREIQDRLHYEPSTYPIVSQIHLVPTLAYMLGVPIPFGNLGALIPDVVMHDDDPLQHMTHEFRHNAHQVRHYLEQYSAHTGHPGFSADALNPIYEHLVNAENNEVMGDLENAIFEYDRFLTSTIKYCQAIWAQFDVGSMAVGISILVLTTCSSIYLSFVSEPSLSFHRTLIVAASTLLVSSSVAVVALKDDIRSHGWFEKMSETDIFLSLVMMVCASVLLFGIKDQRHSNFSFTWIIVLLGAIVHALTLGSNSFVVWEDRMTRFIAATLCVWWAICTRRLVAPISILVWIRFTGLAGQCREEQFPYCRYLHSMSFTADHPIAMFGYVAFNALLISYILPHL
ncbi:alkaline phosphatase-like protein, partial [Lichtheimia hyalospora FSU 10163]